MAATARKDPLRALISHQRSLVTPRQWADEDAARTGSVLRLLGPEPGEGRVVALYAARRGEPGTPHLIEELARDGWRILLPLLKRTPDWAWYRAGDPLAPGWAGIPQPAGPGQGAEAIALAEIVVAPCLAVGLDGTRLGTGGGWYDRVLPHRKPGAKVLVLARDEEVFDTVPSEPHDIGVDIVVTQTTVRNLRGS